MVPSAANIGASSVSSLQQGIFSSSTVTSTTTTVTSSFSSSSPAMGIGYSEGVISSIPSNIPLYTVQLGDPIYSEHSRVCHSPSHSLDARNSLFPQQLQAQQVLLPSLQPTPAYYSHPTPHPSLSSVCSPAQQWSISPSLQYPGGGDAVALPRASPVQPVQQPLP